MPPHLKLMRPKQWVKNVFVFLPLIFTGLFTDPDAVIQVLFAFVMFCLASSATYILNDWQDIEADRQHPTKQHSRPLASGQVSIRSAKFMLAILYSILLVIAVFQPMVALVISGYIVLNLAYSFYLKHQPILDIFTIALGFVLRVYAGSVAIDVPVSGWMFITTLCLALYLGAIKRRQELLTSGPNTRGVLKEYSIELIDRYAEMSAIGALMFYSLFVMSEKPELVYSIPLVLYGLFRYWYLVDRHQDGESPTDVLYKDGQLVLTILIWGGLCLYSLLPS
ncbi:MAG: decaprenyl-phosphate phosphoribosyltransferase [Oceanospirillaceae bacterium]|jgi:decaprenyl-phosphate phosphoribosyltransferase